MIHSVPMQIFFPMPTARCHAFMKEKGKKHEEKKRYKAQENPRQGEREEERGGRAQNTKRDAESKPNSRSWVICRR